MQNYIQPGLWCTGNFYTRTVWRYRAHNNGVLHRFAVLFVSWSGLFVIGATVDRYSDSNLMMRSFNVVKACLSFIVNVCTRLALSGTDMITTSLRSSYGLAGNSFQLNGNDVFYHGDFVLKQIPKIVVESDSGWIIFASLVSTLLAGGLPAIMAWEALRSTAESLQKQMAHQ